MSESLGRVQLVEPTIGARERERVDAVLSSGMIASGEEVDSFERAFAEYCGADEAVATANGTAALHAALDATGIGPGDRVITTPFSFIATANAIRFVGATPRFVDIDPATFAIDVEAVETAINDGPPVDAVLAVHLYGLPAAMDRLAAVAEANDVVLIEDAAQAHGATLDGQRVGTFGDAGCFSFYPSKNMTTGEGGMVTTDSRDVADRVRRFINHGRTGQYEHASIGYNFRMTDIAAAIGRVQLDRLPAANESRREHAAELTDALAALPLTTPIEPPNRRHVYHQYTIRTERRDELRRHLDAHGIETGVYYPKPIHRQRPYRSRSGRFPEAERAASEVLSLPIHPRLATRELEAVIEAVRTWDR